MPASGIVLRAVAGVPLLAASRKAARVASRLILPEYCPACGRELSGAEGALCRDCEAALVPIGEPRCPACGKALLSEQGSCMRCRGRSWSFDLALPLYPYRGPAAALISAYKFGDRPALAARFVPALETLMAAWPGATLVPVPFRRAKIREHGWDQVEELARRLERRGHPVARVLERLPSGEQKKLGLEARFGNARIAYRLKPGATPPREAILLDDVFTTGATAEACASALKAGGSSFVAFLALAAD